MHANMQMCIHAYLYEHAQTGVSRVRAYIHAHMPKDTVNVKLTLPCSLAMGGMHLDELSKR